MVQDIVGCRKSPAWNIDKFIVFVGEWAKDREDEFLARYNETWYSGWQGLVIVTIVYAVVLTAVSWSYNRKANS